MDFKRILKNNLIGKLLFKKIAVFFVKILVIGTNTKLILARTSKLQAKYLSLTTSNAI